MDFEASCRGPLEWDWSSLPVPFTPADLDPILTNSFGFSEVCAWPFGASPSLAERPRLMAQLSTT